MTQHTAENEVDGQVAKLRGGSGACEPFNLDQMVYPQLFRDYCDGASSGAGMSTRA